MLGCVLRLLLPDPLQDVPSVLVSHLTSCVTLAQALSAQPIEKIKIKTLLSLGAVLHNGIYVQIYVQIHVHTVVQAYTSILVTSSLVSRIFFSPVAILSLAAVNCL